MRVFQHLRVYVASSWRNPLYSSVIDALRAAGHAVFDWRESGFHFPNCTTRLDYVQALGHTYFRTGYGDRERPYLLKIKEWVKLGPDRADSVTLPAPDTPVLSGRGAPATASEIIQDKIPF